MSDTKHKYDDVDDVTGIGTTGHEWDGIKELDNPLPRWWLYIFYATILYAVVYWVLMPAWPALPGAPAHNDHTVGMRGHSDRANVAAEVAALQTSRAPSFQKLLALGEGESPSDPGLISFATAAGQSAFGDNCATCHGAGAQGSKGYPNLNDNDWLWGGTLADIERTLHFGIRSGHEDARISQMPAYGRDQLLEPKQIADVTEYVLQISGQEHNAAAATRGAETFAAQCSACHGPTGAGDRSQGAANLSDKIWLFGGDRESILTQINNGRGGVMPNWQGRLDEGTIRALAIYVHGLGGGEAAPPPAPVDEVAPAEPASAAKPTR
jgi:cytochrome c oxidase cbb3-type subunit III